MLSPKLKSLRCLNDGRPMNIWLVQRWESLPVDEGQQRMMRTGLLAEALLRRGHDVLWWTSAFNHELRTHRYDKDTLVTVSPHYRLWIMHGGGYKKNISLARIIDHRNLARKFQKLSVKESKPDIILSSLPTVELCREAVEYGRREGVPVVLDMRDMWPDIFVDIFPRSLQRLVKLGLWPMFEEARKACSMATAICGVTDPFVDWGIQRGKRKRTPMDRSFPLAYQSSQPDSVSLQEAQTYWDALGVHENDKDFVVCYTGALNLQFDLETAILAVKKALMNGISIKLVICGNGERLAYYKKIALGMPNIIFTGYINRAKLYVLMRRSTVGLDPLPDRYDFLVHINNKAIEYLSAGLPVISCPNKGVLYGLLQERHCGLSYEHGNVDGLFSILSQLTRNRGMIASMAANALELFKEKFSAEKVYHEMACYTEEIAVGFQKGTRWKIESLKR